jgi:hypothetical protein
VGVTDADLIESFDLQAGWCSRLGSPLYADLLTIAREDLVGGGVVASVVEDFDLDPVEAALPLRYLGGLHRLVLMQVAPRLGRHFPSVGGTPDRTTLALDLLATTGDHIGYLRDALGVAPQTNEVGRSAVLFPALATAVARDRMAVRLLELGAAGGLNLMLDRFHYDMGVWEWGKKQGPRIHAAWRGERPVIPDELEIRERGGCDVVPLDVTDAQQRLRLLSFVWADQLDRFERMTDAIATAVLSPPRVEQGDAAEWLASRLERRTSDVLTVVQHSIMWQYLTSSTQDEVDATLRSHGADATDRAPLVHVAFERSGPPGVGGGFEVSMTRWPGGDTEVLGSAHAHGSWVEWGG